MSLSVPLSLGPLARPRPAASCNGPLDARGRALEYVAGNALHAPSVHGSQPWRIELHADHLALRADPYRQGRELVQSAGAALFSVRVALAERGWASETDRLPHTDDPDLLAVVRPVPGVPDPALAALEPSVDRRWTNRRRFIGAHVRDAVLGRLIEIAETDGVILVPVVDEAHQRLVARLIGQADGLQDDAVRLHLGGGRGSARTHSDDEQTMVLLATCSDDPLSWLRAGEALQHVLMEMTRIGWVASPIPQAIEVPLTRTRLRAALTWDAHPQMLFRISQAPPTPPAAAVPAVKRCRASRQPPHP
jgi:hypothetical protein